MIYPPTINENLEVANLTGKKSTHTRIWCKRICLSVCNQFRPLYLLAAYLSPYNTAILLTLPSNGKQNLQIFATKPPEMVSPPSQCVLSPDWQNRMG